MSGIEIIKGFIEEIEEVRRNTVWDSDFSISYKNWKKKVKQFITGIGLQSDFNEMVIERNVDEDLELEKGNLLALIYNLENPKNSMAGPTVSNAKVKKIKPKVAPGANKVFIVHGHDDAAKTKVARFTEKLGLEAIILHEQPNNGRTIIEKFENHAAEVSYAIVLFTPDDTGKANKEEKLKPRARQNVVLELGYFVGALGRKNVCVLHKGNVEIPSDYLGVLYVAIDDSDNWVFKIAKEMKSAGLSIDLNRIC